MWFSLYSFFFFLTYIYSPQIQKLYLFCFGRRRGGWGGLQSTTFSCTGRLIISVVLGRFIPFKFLWHKCLWNLQNYFSSRIIFSTSLCLSSDIFKLPKHNDLLTWPIIVVLNHVCWEPLVYNLVSQIQQDTDATNLVTYWVYLLP